MDLGDRHSEGNLQGAGERNGRLDDHLSYLVARHMKVSTNKIKNNNEVLLFETIWLDLENVMLSKISQTWRGKRYMDVIIASRNRKDRVQNMLLFSGYF